MGGDTLLAAYEVTIREENILIQGGKLSPRSLMPFFPNMPTVAPIPTMSTSQPLVMTAIASTSSNEFGELKDMM